MRLMDKRDRRYPDGVVVADLPKPATGNKLFYDDEVKGFACRVTATGGRGFVLNFHIHGRERRYAIGLYPDWSVAAARGKAKELKRAVDEGRDPLANRQTLRDAPTFADLIDRFKQDYLPAKRASTQRDYGNLLDRFARPALGAQKVAEIAHADIDKLHREVSKQAPYSANRLAAILSKCFTLAIRWQWRSDNPVKGLERNHEDRRNRYLSGEELAHLATSLQEYKDQRSANAIRLLLLTGARRMEVLAATWDMFDLERGHWTKPSAHTKQKKEHRIPLSAPARKLLVEMRSVAEKLAKDTGQPISPYLFPGNNDAPHLTDIKKTWESVTRRASVLLWSTKPETGQGAIVARLTINRDGRTTLPSFEAVTKTTTAEKLALPAGLTDCRIHDLRHTYASILASAGMPLTVIGALLGHTQPATTSRYTHLFDDPLRAATERAAAIIQDAGMKATAAVRPENV